MCQLRNKFMLVWNKNILIRFVHFCQNTWQQQKCVKKEILSANNLVFSRYAPMKGTNFFWGHWQIRTHLFLRESCQLLCFLGWRFFSNFVYMYLDYKSINWQSYWNFLAFFQSFCNVIFVSSTTLHAWCCNIICNKLQKFTQ